MTNAERRAMLRGAAYMREKIAQSLESNPRKAIYECGAHVRANIRLPADAAIQQAQEKWLDADIASEMPDEEHRSGEDG